MSFFLLLRISCRHRPHNRGAEYAFATVPFRHCNHLLRQLLPILHLFYFCLLGAIILSFNLSCYTLSSSKFYSFIFRDVWQYQYCVSELLLVVPASNSEDVLELELYDGIGCLGFEAGSRGDGLCIRMRCNFIDDGLSTRRSTVLDENGSRMLQPSLSCKESSTLPVNALTYVSIQPVQKFMRRFTGCDWQIDHTNGN